MNLLKLAFDSPIVYRLGWTLLHFVWEGAAIALVLGALLAMLRGRGAAARYSACCAGLLLLAILPVVTFLLVPARSTKVAASSLAVTKPPAIDLLNAPVIRDNSAAHAGVIPVSAPAASKQMPPKSQGKSPTPAAAASVAQTPPPNWFTRTFRQSMDFLPLVLPWLVLAWCVGAVVLSIYNLGGWMAVRRLRLLATSAVSDDIADTAGSLARRMGITRAIRILQSTLIDSPMVIGAIKPIILLPASLLTGLSPSQIESLLAHELAHVRRHDYLINLLQGIIETMLFYHPAIWWVSRRIRIERELCCDDRVIAITQNRAAYVRALAAVAESTSGEQKGRELLFSRSAKGAGAFAVAASGGALLPRVRRLLGLPDADAARSPRWLAGAVALGLCVLATGTIVARAADKPDPAKDKDFDVPKTWVLELEVVDKELGEPIPKLSLGVRVDNRQFSFITDDQGHAHIEYPQGFKYLVITPKASGFVPITLSWRNFNGKDPLPDTFKLQLERGTTIGGIVNDEAGKPVANVVVQMTETSRTNDDRVQTDLYNYPIKTDAQGRWRCDVVPRQMSQPSLRLSHPDYLSDEMFGQTPVPPLPKLRDMSGVMILMKGLAVVGKVLDDQGKPIAGAHIYQGADRFGSHYPETKSDADGNFHFAHCRTGGELILTVTAKGRSPDQKSFMLDKELNDIEFRLEPGHILKGRVVDPDGKAVPNVMVATDTWRGHRALLARLDTDAQGNFVWKEAPADEVLTDFLKQGYMDKRQVAIKPSNEDIVVTLRPPVRVSGTVVDADTGKPVENYKVLQGIAWENQPEITWQRGDPAIQPKDGKFEFDINGAYPGYAVRIESPEYEPAVSRVFKDNEGNISLEFKLKKGRVLAGILKTIDGKPLADAEVVLCTGTNGPYITNGQISQHERQMIVKSDQTGRYQLPPQTGKFALVVIHSLGYAEVRAEQLAASYDITVQPWGKVDGTLRIGSKAGARQIVTVTRQEAVGQQPEAPRVYHDLRGTTDEAGHFSFDRVPPGKVSVSMQVQFSEMTYGSTQALMTDVKAGETAHVDIGGVGRPVIGKLALPPQLEGKTNLTSENAFMMTKIDNLPDYRPANWDKMDEDAHKKFVAEYLKSPLYLNYMNKLETRRTFSIRIKSDGTFRVDDIPAGVYQFSSIMMEPSNKGNFAGEAMATASADVIVPEMPGGRSDEPLDIGTIPFKAVKRLIVGNVAPAIDAKTFEGKPIKLEDFKGKFVLLFFYSSDKPITQADFALMFSARDRFGKDSKFELLGLCFGEKIEAAKKFAAEQKLTGTQAFLGEWGKSPIPEAWSLRYVPSAVLVSPEGKVIAKDLSANNIASAIESAMKPVPKN